MKKNKHGAKYKFIEIGGNHSKPKLDSEVLLEIISELSDYTNIVEEDMMSQYLCMEFEKSIDNFNKIKEINDAMD